MQTWCGDITEYDVPFGLGLALHACGEASDLAMRACVEAGALLIALALTLALTLTLTLTLTLILILNPNSNPDLNPNPNPDLAMRACVRRGRAAADRLY